MPPDLDEYWQCQICYQHFPSDKELRRHIEAFQSRVQHLFAELQKCFAHSDLKPPDGEDCGSSSSADNLINDNGDGHEMLLCPHEECDSKLRTSFKTWKSLVTHYTIHVKCCETCRFCGLEIDRVRKYVTHIDSCKTKMKDQRSPEFLSANRITIKQRRILRKKASKELKLKMSTIADASDEEATSQGAHSRKRGREVADPDPENLRQSRKQRIARDGNGDSTVAISSDSPYQVSGADGVSREIATPVHFELSSNSALISTHHTPLMSLPSRCDMDESTALSGNNGPFSAGRTDFLQYTFGSNETLMSDDYIAPFARAPLLFSHTMDGSSSYTAHEYESATHARAPLLCSHTMDGSSSLSMEHHYEATAPARAPLLASHTMDGFSSCQGVRHYNASAQTRITSVGDNTVDRHQSNTQLINEELTALYGNPQAIQILG